MANLTGHYDPNAQAQTDFSPIPAGEYVAVIVDSDMKPTSQNTGEYLELVYEINEGDFKGRKLWLRLNLVNANVQTVEIANRQFASVREAVGVANPRDSQDLHHKPHLIRVDYIKAGETRGRKTYDRDTNEIKAWKKLEGVSHATASSPAANSAPAGGPPPWAKNAA